MTEPAPLPRTMETHIENLHKIVEGQMPHALKGDPQAADNCLRALGLLNDIYLR